jgi:hypothetical protein
MTALWANFCFGVTVGFVLAVVVGVAMQYRERRTTKKWYEDHPA